VGHFLEVGGAIRGGGMKVGAAYVFVKGGQGVTPLADSQGVYHEEEGAATALFVALSRKGW
jgi:hypothetical protein